MHKFDSICVDLVQVLEADGQTMQAECIEEAKAIHKIIENIFRDNFFDEVGILDIMPQNNQILQKLRGVFSDFCGIYNAGSGTPA